MHRKIIFTLKLYLTRAQRDKQWGALKIVINNQFQASLTNWKVI